METTKIFSVPDISCAHCEHAIKSEVENITGVTAVEVDLDSKKVTIVGEELDTVKLLEAISEAGYEASLL